MHPILSKTGRLVLYLVAWIPIGFLLAALLALRQARPWSEALAVALPLAIVYAFLCLAAWPLCRSLPLGRTAVRLVATHAGAGAISAAMWVAAGRGWVELLSGLAGFETIEWKFPGDSVLLFVAGVLLFLLSTVLHYLMIAFEESQEAQRRALELQVHAREAELKALRAQVNPHFLFNSLNSISALAGSDPAAARRMCLLLAEFLRMSLRSGAKEEIPLADELALVEMFLAVEQVRFGTRLAFDRRVDREAEDCLVPPLLLQPLAENAVNHGIANLLEGGVVRIEARRNGDQVEIVVENPCDPGAPRGGGQGLGLANVRARLTNLNSGEGRLEIANHPESFRVRVILPVVRAARKEQRCAS